MGSFANSVFSVLLGWIRTAVNEFWNILSSGEGGGMLAWIGENWKALHCGGCDHLCDTLAAVPGMGQLLPANPWQGAGGRCLDGGGAATAAHAGSAPEGTSSRYAGAAYGPGLGLSRRHGPHRPGL